MIHDSKFLIRGACCTLLVQALITTTALSASAPVTRRDGFLMLWQTIRRPAVETREQPFSDVVEGDRGFLEITYAKSRGIIDDIDPAFHPDAPLAEADALLWLLRTRNVDDIERLTPENVDALLERYPIASTVGSRAPSITADELRSFQIALDKILNEETHEVSLYGEEFHGDGTAFGEAFDMNALTAAHRTLPYNTLVRVTNVDNGKAVTVRINDRGPYVKGRDMDLSLGAFVSIAERSKGKIMARFERLGDASMIGGCGGAPMYRQRITRDVRLAPGIPHLLGLGQTLTLRANAPFVVRGITYPDGSSVRMQDFIVKGEAYSFTPSVAGTYGFLLGDIRGRRRVMEMTVIQCENSPAVEQKTSL